MLLGGATNGFESILRQSLNGESINWGTVLFDTLIGVGTAGVFHGAGKLFEASSPFVKKAFNKVSSELSENARIAKIALNNMEKGPRSVVLGSNLGNVDEVVRRFAKEVKNAKNGIIRDEEGIPRILEMEVSFKRNAKHDAVEFERQLKAQEKGMNSLSVDEFMKNRDRYLKEGRASEGNAAQRLARQEALKEKVLEFRKQGMDRKEANKKAEEWIKGQAALHDPDQIAGGNPTKITSMGDKRINSSLGSQWKSRIGDIDKQIRDIAKKMSEEERKSTYLNIKLNN